MWAGNYNLHRGRRIRHLSLAGSMWAGNYNARDSVVVGVEV